MRLVELLESRMTAKVKDAILVMMSRSKTVGEPYELSYRQLARIMDYPGEITKTDIETVMNDDPTLAASISNFDEDFIEVDANAPAASAVPPADQAAADADAELGADLDTALDTGLDAGANMGMAAPPESEPAPAADELEEPVEKQDTVKKMADRAAKRRSK